MTQIHPKIERLVGEAEQDCRAYFDRLDDIERHNTRRVLEAFQKHRVSARHFAPTTGYGYDDIGRDTLSEIMAELLGCESALVRPQIASGTHALALCLYVAVSTDTGNFSCWRPAGDPTTRWRRSSGCPARPARAL